MTRTEALGKLYKKITGEDMPIGANTTTEALQKVYEALTNDTTHHINVTEIIDDLAANWSDSGGGGGSSDFSTAEVTVIGDAGIEEFSVNGMPILMSDRLDSSPIIQNNNSETYTIPLYKGKTLFTIAWTQAISSTGNVSYDEELDCYVATGDGTITVRPMD